MALCTFWGVISVEVPLLSCPTGAHFPHVLKSFRHCSYCARSAALSAGATAARVCEGAGACPRATCHPPASPAIITAVDTAVDFMGRILLWRQGAEVRGNSDDVVFG